MRQFAYITVRQQIKADIIAENIAN